MLFMVIEHFKPGKAPEIYRRFRAQGRMEPPGVKYVASWVDEEYVRCFQVMEAPDEASLIEWTRRWDDLCEFELVPVRTSAEAAAKMAELGP